MTVIIAELISVRQSSLAVGRGSAKGWPDPNKTEDNSFELSVIATAGSIIGAESVTAFAWLIKRLICSFLLINCL